MHCAAIDSNENRYPDWTASLCNLYWQLRHLKRIERHRRRLYRAIEAEKMKLFEKNFDPEEVRLLCRHLAQPWNKRAERTYFGYCDQGRFPDF